MCVKIYTKEAFPCMREVFVLINTIEKVKQFVQSVSSYEGDLDLSTGRYIIDAKSIMGIFSLDISSPLKLIIHNDETADGLIAELKDYIVGSDS